MSDISSVWETTLQPILTQALSVIGLFLEEVLIEFNALPWFLRVAFYILLFMAILGIAVSHIKGILNNKGAWKADPKSSLMFSYFCGTGAVQRKLIYHDAHSFLHDRKWSWISFAGLAYRLGNVTHQSKSLLFVCSLLYLPLAILGFVEMVIRNIIGTVYLFAASLVHSILLLVLRILSFLLIRVWRIADKSARIDQHCPNCYETFSLTSFRCPSCGKVHKDLFPGRNGIIVARCECGKFLASSALTGRSALSAVCPACEAELVAANAKQFSIQLVGGTAAGKTAYLAAFHHLYVGRANRIRNLTVQGKPSEYFDDLETMFACGQTWASSETAVLTYSFLHTEKRSSKHNLVIYDIPGGVVLNGGYERNPRNLGFTNGILIIVDPLSIESVRNECYASGGAGEVDNYSPDDVNEVIVEFVHQMSSITGRSAKRQIDVPVAVVIGKADIKAIKREIGLPKIKSTFNANPSAYRNDITVARDTICRAYLQKLGLDNALNNLDGIFSNVRYFPVSAMGHAGSSAEEFAPFGVVAPIAWISGEANFGGNKFVQYAQKEDLE